LIIARDIFSEIIYIRITEAGFILPLIIGKCSVDERDFDSHGSGSTIGKIIADAGFHTWIYLVL